VTAIVTRAERPCARYAEQFAVPHPTGGAISPLFPTTSAADALALFGFGRKVAEHLRVCPAVV